MALRKKLVRTAASLAMLMALGSLTALASPPSGEGPPEGPGCSHDGPPMGPGPRGFGGGPGGGMDFEANRPPPYLHDVDLSDEQQDKLFAILHAAAPSLREQSKAARKAHEALRQLAHAAKFDDAAAASLSSAEAKATSQLTLARLHVDHDIYAVLTVDQRTALEKREHEHDAHRRGGPPRD